MTSVRVPQALREAARLLQDEGLISSWNDVLVQGARERLESITHRAGLDTHYREHPEVRPTLSEVALALARMDTSELSGHPELIEQAARELVEVRPLATPDDVLTYAVALLAHHRAA